MEADDARLESVILEVITAELLGKQFLPAVARLRVRRKRIFFLQRLDLRILLLGLVVYAGLRGKQKALDAILPAGFEHVRIDQNVVAANIGMVRSNVTDPAHVGS